MVASPNGTMAYPRFLDLAERVGAKVREGNRQVNRNFKLACPGCDKVNIRVEYDGENSRLVFRKDGPQCECHYLRTQIEDAYGITLASGDLTNLDANAGRPDESAETPAQFVSYDAAAWINNIQPVEWIVDRLFPKESKILLSAGPKVGKSFLATALMKASVERSNFLGRPVPDITPCWFFTETDARSFFNDCAHLGFEVPAGSIKVFPLHDNRMQPHEFAKAFTQAFESATTPPKLVVLDVLGRWMPSEDITNYSKTGRVLEALEEVAYLVKATGGTLWANHHSRKGASGNSNESSLGTQAIAGFFDQIVMLSKVDKDTRKLVTDGRFPEYETAFQWNGSEMVALDLRAASDDDILDCLELGDHTAQEIHGYIKDDDGKPSLRTVQMRLTELVRNGSVVKVGGSKNTTYRLS